MDDVLREDKLLYNELPSNNSEAVSFDASVQKQKWEQAAGGIAKISEGSGKSAQTFAEIAQHGFTIDINTPPFKNFDSDKGERFLIQKCKDAGGRDVVVKMSSTEDVSRQAVNREALKYNFLGASVNATPDSLSIRFPQLTDRFSTLSGQEALAVTYEKDDPMYKQSLTPEQQTEVVIRTLKDLHKLVVPVGIAEQEKAKPWDQRDIDVSTADQVQASLQRHVDSLASQGILPIEMAQNIIQLAQADSGILDALPLKIAHGDLHMGNLAISQNEKTGESDVIVMDIEALRVSNEFYDVAHIANKIEAYRQVLETYELPAAQKQVLSEILDQMGDPQLIPKLEAAFIENKDDEKSYVLMRLYDSIRELDDNSKNPDGRARIIRDIYPRMITSLLVQAQAA